MNSINRRTFLRGGLALAGVGLLGACGTSTSSAAPALVIPNGPQVNATDARRYRDGTTRSFAYTASTGQIDLGGPTVDTWSYDGVVPGRELRVNAGDQVRVQVTNQLPQPTTMHWHGLDIRNDMDGVPDVTQNAIAAGSSFAYSYTVDAPGTYWFHPHVGVQFDRGLYGPLIVEDPHEPLSYDEDWVVVLDDWLDGVNGLTPDNVYAALSHGMGGMSSPTPSPSSTQVRPDSGVQLRQPERFGDVIVRADLQPHNNVHLVAASSEDDQDRLRLDRSQLPADLHSAEVRKAQAEQHDIDFGEPRRAQGAFPRAMPHNPVSVEPQAGFEHAADRLVVLHQQEKPHPQQGRRAEQAGRHARPAMPSAGPTNPPTASVPPEIADDRATHLGWHVGE
jgi:hypothetical protein